MRYVIGLLIFAIVSIAPRVGSAQVSVTSPAAGAASSYRKAVISWNPIPGAASYHLEIDDDPNFGSPEVDVTVTGTSYALSGQRLRLNGQQSWAAYVRINGMRWNANTFTPSYFGAGNQLALAVTSQNLVFLAFHDIRTRIHLVASSDWSSRKLLSLADTFNADTVNLAVDEFDVAHAFWLEQRPSQNRTPFYTNSATGWDLVQSPIAAAGCSHGSSFAARGQFDIFMSCNTPNEITRWTITNGTQFTRTTLPNSADTDSATAARDGVGNVYVASTRHGVPTDQTLSVLQGSGDGWIPHTAAAGLRPTVAVTREGELHALQLGWGDATGVPFLYSNSLRGFQTWTTLPIRSPNYVAGEVLPLLVDTSHRRLYTAIRSNGAVRGSTGPVHICSAPHTGVASSAGTTWTCVPVGDQYGMLSVGALAPDGTVHFAWRDLRGHGYANSLGSFLATNFTPQVSFGAVSNTPSAVAVPVTIRDADGDDLEGQIRVGHAETSVSLIWPSTYEYVLNGSYELRNDGNATFGESFYRLEFRPMGAASWTTRLHRDTIGPSLPNRMEVRVTATHQIVGSLEISNWDDTGVTISHTGVVPSLQLTYSGTLPTEIDISLVPAGEAAVEIGVADGSTWGFGQKSFTKTAGQTRLLLTTP